MALQYEQLKQEFIDEFGLGVLAPEKQDEIIASMMEAVMKRIFVDTMEKLGETGMDEYEKFLEQKPEQVQIEEFLKSKIANYDVMIDNIVTEFKGEMKGNK
jgi:hypothetical protein